jgi:hypothetical protein
MIGGAAAAASPSRAAPRDVTDAAVVAAEVARDLASDEDVGIIIVKPL